MVVSSFRLLDLKYGQVRQSVPDNRLEREIPRREIGWDTRRISDEPVVWNMAEYSKGYYRQLEIPVSMWCRPEGIEYTGSSIQDNVFWAGEVDDLDSNIRSWCRITHVVKMAAEFIRPHINGAVGDAQVAFEIFRRKTGSGVVPGVLTGGWIGQVIVLVYRVDEPRVVMLLFGSGKIVCTGAKEIKDIDLALKEVMKELTDAGLI